jgi:sporulation protein YlmC with PRC-barrel domain
MNKIEKILVVLGFIFCFVLVGNSAFSQGYREEFPVGTVGAMYQPMGWNTYEASWLIGHHVRTAGGGSLGQISSLVIDKTNERIVLVILSDVPNLGAESLAIPFSSIERTGQDIFEFNPGDMKIWVAPGYSDPDVYTVTHYRYPGSTGFYGLPSGMDIAWLSEIYRHYSQTPYWTEKGEPSPMTLELYESTELMGAKVQLPKGETAGQINDFVIDSSDGRIPFLVLYNVSGRGDDLVTIPFGTLESRGESVFVINTTEQHLASAPSFNEFSDLSNPRWAGDVYRYFGQQPYWSEKEEMAPIYERPMRMEPKPHTLEWHERYGY